MIFYVLRTLFPALLVDILVVAMNVRRKKKSRWSAQSRRRDNWIAAFAPAPLYLVDAFIWIHIYGGDSRFQGQGAIGIIVFLGVGIALFFVRLRLGLFFVKI